jgi:hypothetical protein
VTRITVVGLFVTVVVLIETTHYKSNVDRVLVLFTGLALVAAVLVFTPSKRDERAQRAQLDSARHLARIVELLEQQQQREQNTSTVVMQSPRRRRSTSKVLALVLLAFVVARARR